MAAEAELLKSLRVSTRFLVDSFSAPGNIWPLGDVNMDGVVDEKDADLIAASYGKKAGETGYNPAADLNNDGVVDMLDVGILNAGAGARFTPGWIGPPGLPDVQPGAPIPGVWNTSHAEAEATVTEFAKYSAAASAVDFFGGSVGSALFGQPGWKARLSRAEEIFLSPFTYGVAPLLQAYWNSQYTPVLPSVQDLLRMLLRGLIEPADYLNLAGYLGFGGRFSVDLLDIAYKLPEFRDLQMLLWRGEIDEATFKKRMLNQGWHPDVIDQMYELAWQIPGPADLIRFVVREVIPPIRFIDEMRKQGFAAWWAGVYWAAHFVLPAPSFLIDAFHRGVISDAELQKYIFWHDYSPDPRPGIEKTDIEIMRSLTKTLIPRVDLRYGWELGRISDAQLVKRYEYLGYEGDAELMADIQKARAMTAENNAIASAAASLYRDGYMPRAELEGWLRTANFSQARIDKTLAAEDLRYRLDYVKDLQAVAIEAYQKDVYTLEDLEAELLNLGMQPERVKALITKESFKKLPKPKPAPA